MVRKSTFSTKVEDAALAALPATSNCVAVIEKDPSTKDGTVKEKAPLIVLATVFPAIVPFMDIVTEAPKSAVPVMIGVVTLVKPGAESGVKANPVGGRLEVSITNCLISDTRIGPLDGVAVA